MPSLYQVHRPQRFADLIGQEPVVTTLKNALMKGLIGHAYLFSGPKGSGKTTTARLLAKAVNCQQRKRHEAEPCNRCTHCKAIDEASSLDILEIDAASHRSIEEIRELREAVQFAPAMVARKVYIIDEVHMLTREAFNALLKTLEEPPPHALFILATTEPHKVPATIKSRTQHLLFRRAGVADLVAYLAKVAKAEKIAIEEDSLKLIAGTAEGSFRDSLTALEQVWAAHPKSTIKSRDVQTLLGLADRELVFLFLEALAKKDLSSGMAVIRSVSDQGVDVQSFLRHTLDLLRSILLLFSRADQEVAAAHTKEEVVRLEKIREGWDITAVTGLMERLIEAGRLARIAPVPELPLEMLVAEMTAKEEGIEKRATKEQEGEDLLPPTPSHPSSSSNPSVPIPVAKAIEKIDERVWKSILSEVREANASLYSILREAIVLGQTADGVALGVRFRFHAELLSAAKNQSVLTEAVTKVMGKPAQITVELKPEVFTKQEEELLKMAEELL